MATGNAGQPGGDGVASRLLSLLREHWLWWLAPMVVALAVTLYLAYVGRGFAVVQFHY